MPQISAAAARMGEEVGAVLRSKREGRGLTRAVVEDAAGLSRSTLRRIEKGLRAPTVPELAMIVAAINERDDADLPDVTVLEVITTAVSRSTTPS